MKRRQALRLAAVAVAAAALLLSGHTPYGQWSAYRKKLLLIGCHKADPQTYKLAKLVVARLGEHLPAAKSRVARAPNVGRLASLLATAQLDVAAVDTTHASDILNGVGVFAPYGPIALRILTPVADRLLIARADFPPRHAWLVTGALFGSQFAPAHKRTTDSAIPWHPGSPAFVDGQPQPDERHGRR